MLNQPDSIQITLDGVVAGPNVNGDIASGFGSVDVSVAGGAGTYTYSWTATLADGSSYVSGTEDISGLFAGTYTLVVTDENSNDSGCSETLVVVVPFYGPADWSVDETGAVHTIAIPQNASITIDYDAISYGDYIAVANSSGDIAGMVMWNGSAEVMSVYANGDVFTTGDIFYWKLWDASTGEYYDAEAVYDASYPNTDAFAVGGQSGVLDIVAQTVYRQKVDLLAGWGLYSTFISPIDANIETVFSDAVSDIIIIKSETGDVYWPSLGMNFIGSLTDGEGYQIKMAASHMGENALEISGDLIPSNYDMFLPSGWSYMAYLHQEALSVEGMMAPLSSNLIILKDGLGSVYWPAIGINNINTMEGGKGYQIKVTGDETFSYPDATASNRFAAPGSLVYPLVKFAKAQNTGSNMTIGIPLDSWASLPNEGDEIAAYSQQGMLVGSVTFTGESTALTVWGDDITTDDVDGLLEGEEILFEIWRKSEDRIDELKINSWREGNNVYSINGIALAGNISSKASGLGYQLYPNVPNPFGSMTSISFFAAEEGNVKLGVYDMLGNLVKELTNEDYSPGMYVLEFRPENIAPGTYFVRMTAAGFSKTNTISTF